MSNPNEFSFLSRYIKWVALDHRISDQKLDIVFFLHSGSSFSFRGEEDVDVQMVIDKVTDILAQHNEDLLVSLQDWEHDLPVERGYLLL